MKTIGYYLGALVALVAMIIVPVVWVTGLIGWILNIVHLFHANFDNLTLKLALQLVGVVLAPLGAICGWLF